MSTEPTLPIIAFWSESSNIDLSRFAFEMVGLSPGEIPRRYYLFDWAFETYRDLAAIIFFELRNTEPVEDFWTIVNQEQVKLFPFGLVITNPYHPDVEDVLKRTLTKHCHIITGIIKPSA